MEPPSVVVDSILALITVIATIGTAVSMQNRKILIKLADGMSDITGRMKVIEEWRVGHERWKEQQISELKAHISDLDRGRGWDGMERRRKLRRGLTEE
jgi:hypothetical protein